MREMNNIPKIVIVSNRDAMASSGIEELFGLLGGFVKAEEKPAKEEPVKETVSLKSYTNIQIAATLEGCATMLSQYTGGDPELDSIADSIRKLARKYGNKVTVPEFE